jgi:hypothetical protein
MAVNSQRLHIHRASDGDQDSGAAPPSITTTGGGEVTQALCPNGTAPPAGQHPMGPQTGPGTPQMRAARFTSWGHRAPRRPCAWTCALRPRPGSTGLG